MYQCYLLLCRTGRGPYCYRVHGQVYHHLGALHPARPGAPRQYAQLYVVDTAAANEERLGRVGNNACRPNTMADLERMLTEHNPHVRAFRSMAAVLEEEERAAAADGRALERVALFFHREPQQDRRRFNDPVGDEVAAVFVGRDGEPPVRDLAVYPRGDRLQTISCLSPHADPLVYPLLFPHGELGWRAGVQHVPERAARVRHQLTHLQHYAYRLAVRPGFSVLHSAGKLLQQFAVDAYTRVVANRLQYLRQHQALFRAEVMQGLADHLHGEDAARPVGRQVVLPASFTGSPRAMQQAYQDAMAVIARFCSPDLFVTFTCNPRWEELAGNVGRQQRVEHRPDLVARVFHLKLRALLEDLSAGQLLGKPRAMFYVIEYQKRSLPHAHILIILEQDDKIRDANDVDRIVCAELPDPARQPRLDAVIRANMLHGPCGARHPACPFMVDGACSKRFPKAFQAETHMPADGYPLYRRRDDGRTVHVRGADLDNRWVVPYSPKLCVKYAAHINVEVAASIRSVKYLYKYIYKGHDCARVQLNRAPDGGDRADPPDEIEMYLNTRYVCAPEAMWRLFAFEMHHQSHTVVRLAVHLPGRQQVFFAEGDEAAALDRAQRRDSTLTAWFALNRLSPDARQYRYADMPPRYTFNKAAAHRRWQPRRQGAAKVIGRLVSVSATDVERFHLRMLLLHVAGAQSYDDIRTVDGQLCATFREAARRRGLLADDTEWERCMTEAALFRMPRQLRSLFATLCAYNAVGDAAALWEHHAASLTEDLERRFGPAAGMARARQHVLRILRVHGLSGADVGLDWAEEDAAAAADDQDADAAAAADPVDDVGAEARLDTLSAEQRRIADAVLHDVEEAHAAPPQPRATFMCAAAGCGKTYIYNVLIGLLRSRGRTVLPVAWTGIAATLLDGGRTVHSQFKLPVPVVDDSTSFVSAASPLAASIRAASLIVWDEVAMAPSHALDAVDRLLRDLRGNAAPFGGCPVLFGGDFRQIPPVVRNGARAAVVGTSVRHSPLWAHVRTMFLQRNMRADAGERRFCEWLLALGDGRLPPPAAGRGEHPIQLPDDVVERAELVDAVFPEEALQAAPDQLRNRAILCPRNDESLAVNDTVLDRLPGDTVVYNSADDMADEEDDELADVVLVEYLNSITPSGMPPHRLRLKTGAVVMLLRNLGVERGLCNGTRLVVRHLGEAVINAEVITGAAAGERVLLPRMTLQPSDTGLPFKFRRRQFPVRLGYALTINKAQGQTFDMVGLSLRRPVFAHGQLYVALSRVRRQAALRVKVVDATQQGRLAPGHHTYTQNVVYQELLTAYEPAADQPEPAA